MNSTSLDKKVLDLLSNSSLSAEEISTIQQLKSKADKASFVDHIQDVIYQLDLNGNIKYMNKSVELYGYQINETIGKSIFDFVFEQDQEKVKKRIEDVVNNPNKPYDPLAIKIKSKNGILVPFEVKSRLYKSKEIIGVARDISKLEKTKQFLNEIIESLPGVFFGYKIRPENKFELFLWNKAFETESGYSSNELKNSSPLDRYDEPELNNLKKAMQEVISKGTTTLETKFMHKNDLNKNDPNREQFKTPYLISARKARIQDEIYVIGLGIDITGIKETEEKTRKLEKKFYDLSIQTNLSNLIPRIIHDSNNILSPTTISIGVLKSCIDLLFQSQNKIDLETYQELEESCKVIKKSAQRIRKLYNSLRIYSKGINIEPHPEFINIYEEIEFLKLAAKDRALKSNKVIKIYTELKGNPLAYFDPTHFPQIALNFVTNAVDACRSEGEIKYIFENKENHTYFKVTDNGQGIPKKFRSKILSGEQFSTKPAGLGTGQGMPGSLYFANINKSSIEYTSEIGKGTTFILKMPSVKNKEYK